MSGSDDEVEQWQRIRDRQIAARDPSAKRTQRNQRLQQRHQAYRKKWTFKDIIKVFPNKVIGLITGVLLGLIAWLVMTIMVDAWWVDWGGLGLIVLFSALGVLLGASFDWRDDLRNF